MALFEPFRALGYITDDVPFAVQRRGSQAFVTVSVGKAWQIYNTDKLRLVLVGPQLKHKIGALACKGDLTFAAVGASIVECKRVHVSGQYSGHAADILQLLVLGDHLLSLGRDGRLLVWRIGQYGAPEVSIQLGRLVPPLLLRSGFTPTCMAHPDTYLNKVVLGSSQGRVQLWNFATRRMLYEFSGWGSPVCCIAPSPALDVVGVGLADGRAVLHNLRYDETVLTFHNASGAGTNADLYLTGSEAQLARQAAGGACTNISFRTGAGVPLMAAGGAAGVVTVWDLEQRRLHTLIRDAHDAPLLSLHFFPGEPLLMSSARDNSIKQWVFDATDGAARLLKFRSGHAAPPTVVRHYGAGKLLLSAGEDRAFRAFSTIQDAQSRELSQHHTARRAKRLKIEERELKLNPVLALDACDVRERDWSNVITAHQDDTRAYVWRLQKYALGEWMLFPPPKELAGAAEAQATAVCLSRCGNFGFVGGASGRLDRYNMQSGMHRGSYCRDPQVMQEAIRKSAPGTPAPDRLLKSPGVKAHDGPVTGVCADGCNRRVASAGADGFIRTWDFKRRSLRAEVRVGVPVTRLCCHPATGLLAAVCEDKVIRMYDVESARLVRQLKGHNAAITDIQISEDCRWLLSASEDGTVRCWDIPGSRVLQVMRLGRPVTSLSLGPGQELLATCHPGRRGIYLWANQMLFGSGADVVPSEQPVRVRLPFVASAEEQGEALPGAQRVQVAQEVEDMLRQSRHPAPPQLAADSSSALARRDEQTAAAAEGSGQGVLAASDDSSDEGEGGLAEQQAEQQRQAQAAAAAALPHLDPARAAEQAAYAARDGAGAPQPLQPELVTLSMLPRTQWQSLVHLNTIKARNKPIEPPKKPEAAPFFLPTVSGAQAGRNPVFDVNGAPAALGQEAGGDAAIAAKAAAAWGDDDEGGAEMQGGSDLDADVDELRRPQNGAADAAANGHSSEEESDGELALSHAARKGGAKRRQQPPGARVLRLEGTAHRSTLLRLLHSCAAAGDWTSLVAHLRGLAPVALDAELRGMQVLEGAGAEAVDDVALLLRFLEEELAANRNFEFLQALLRVALEVHADTILQQPELQEAAQRMQACLAATWRRLDSLLQSCRCMVGLLGNLQA